MNYIIVFILSVSVVFPFTFANAQVGKIPPVDSVFGGSANERVIKKIEEVRNARQSIIEIKRDSLENFRQDKKKQFRDETKKVRNARRSIIDERKDLLKNFKQEKGGQFRNVKEGRKQNLEKLRERFQNERKDLSRGRFDRARLDKENRQKFIEAKKLEIRRFAQENKEQVKEYKEKRDAMRREFKKRREEIRRQIKQKKEEAKRRMEQKREEFKAKIKEIRDRRKAEIAERVFDRFTEIKNRNLDRYSNVFDRLESILERILTRADKAIAHGVDANSISLAADVAKQAIENGRAIIKEKSARVYSVSISDEKNIRSDFEKTKNELKADFKQIHDAIVKAHKTVRGVAEALSKIPKINEFEVEPEAVTSQ